MEITGKLRNASVGLGLTVLLSGAALAQQSVPAETPPATYGGDQYVDSRGCLFVRVGVGNRDEWVPRVGADRQPVCGQDPTFPVAAPIETAVASPVPARPARAVATAPSRQARPTTAAAQPVLIILPPTITIAGATPVECPEVSGQAAAYLARPGVTCALAGPEALSAHPTNSVRRLDLDLPSPPPGYRHAWEDGRPNPYRGVRTVEGEVQMRQIWTDTVPRRLVGFE